LIGPNGAGKTTTLRIVSTLLEITSGSTTVFGYDVKKNPEEVREKISYLPEEAGAYKNLSGKEYLTFMAQFYTNGKDVNSMVETGISISGLQERITDKVNTYSKGMTRKLLVARALMMKPPLAILDEPTSGLDVINSQEVRRIIKGFAQKGSTVLLSSHNMLEVEFLSNRVALIGDGLILDSGTPTELKERYNAQNLEEVFLEAVSYE
jgi:ABC-2 type transport system ATP-binding protein